MKGWMRERSKGRWQIGVTLARNPEGKYPQVSKTVKGTKADARRELNTLVAKYQNVAGTTDVGVTLAAVIQRWIRDIEFEGKSARYLYGCRIIAAKIAAHTVGQIKVTKLRPTDLTDYYRTLTAANLSAATVRRYHAVVSAALGHAEAIEWLPPGHNPARAVKLPREAKREIVPPTPIEVQKLIAAATSRDQGFGMFVRLAATLGARDGELCGLRSSDVSFVDNNVLVARAITHVKNVGLQVKETKARTRRRIGVDQATMDAILAHMEWMQQRAHDNGAELADDPYLFSNSLTGTLPWSPDWASKWFSKVREAAGVECRLHDLRHFVASQLLGARIPVTEVSARLGHKSTRMTLDVYGHFVPTDEQQAADHMARILG